jgi:uncharacterized protein involved in response to NO
VIRRVTVFFTDEEKYYAPFVAGAIFIAVFFGFPLGLMVAHTAAEGLTIGGRWPAWSQVHGHLQLVGWFGLFIVGMGYRLVPRFTAVKVRPPALVPLTFVLLASGLVLRTFAQPWASEGGFAALFATSAVLEAAAAAVFAGVVLRCVALGRRDEFGYGPFFAAGAVWFLAGALMNLYFVADSALDQRNTVLAARSGAITFVMLYGFITMFIFAVSLRTFPIFFGRKPAPRLPVLGSWLLGNAGVALFAGGMIWRSYDPTDTNRVLLSLGFLASALGLLGVAGLLRIFQGTPHRLRETARRSMRFVRSAYAWLVIAAALQAFFAARGLWDGRVPAHFEVDAARHFLAIGFGTVIIVGMSFLVLPRLAMRRVQGAVGAVFAPVLLALLHGSAAARGAGSLVANETYFDEGYWTMAAGGLAGMIAVAAFAAYLVWSPKGPEIAMTARQSPRATEE